MLLVGSYAEASTVTDELLRQKSSWNGQVKCLVGDDEQETGAGFDQMFVGVVVQLHQKSQWR